MKDEIRNARIESTMLGVEDHGILTFMLHLDYGDGSHQGFGGYALDEWNEKLRRRIGTSIGMVFIAEAMKTVGVDQWESLVGEHVRVKVANSKIVAIGHITKDKWLSPSELYSTTPPLPAHS